MFRILRSARKIYKFSTWHRVGSRIFEKYQFDVCLQFAQTSCNIFLRFFFFSFLFFSLVGYAPFAGKIGNVQIHTLCVCVCIYKNREKRCQSLACSIRFEAKPRIRGLLCKRHDAGNHETLGKRCTISNTSRTTYKAALNIVDKHASETERRKQGEETICFNPVAVTEESSTAQLRQYLPASCYE